MRIVTVAIGAVAAGLLGCAGGRLEADPPPQSASLAGVWRLNRAASDDPQKLIDSLRSEALKRMRYRATQDPGQIGAAGPRRSGGSRPGDAQREPPADPSAARVPGDPLRGSPLMQVLTNHLSRSDFLTVRQSANELVLDFGDSVRSYTPGRHSVVSTQGGVADQTSGWKGRDYVIRVKPAMGPEVTEQYGLSADGRHLVEKLHVAASELPQVNLTRVFDPSSEVAPRSLPTTD